jgi:hypothetical protein
MGDGSVRTALCEAVHVILTRPIKGGARTVSGEFLLSLQSL